MNTVIKAAIRKRNPDLTQVSPEAENCCGFGDGNRCETCRTAGWDAQYVCYCSHKHFHGHDSQAVSGPDGIIYDHFEEPAMKENNQYYLTESEIEQQLNDLQFGQLVQYKLHMNKGIILITDTNFLNIIIIELSMIIITITIVAIR